MGFSALDSTIRLLEIRLAKEYGLGFERTDYNVQGFKGWERAAKPEERIKQFCDNLNKLTSGVYIFVEHPGLDTPEMQAIGHKGYENVAQDRDAVTQVFTSKKVKDVILKKKIKQSGLKEIF